MIVFRPPRPQDIAHVAANMRAIDALECRVLGEHSPIEALKDGVDGSDWSVAVEVDGAPVCIFGVASEGFLSFAAAPWLLGVEGIERHARYLLAYTPHYIARMREQYDHLSNTVHASNRHAIRYLKWCGFEFGAPFERHGEPLVGFSWTRAKQKKAA